jgi:hypothetical protein
MGTTLTATYKSNYTKVKLNKATGQPELDANGKVIVNTVFVYRVTGSPEDIKDYTDSKGDYLTTDVDGTPLLFTVSPSPTDVCKLYKVLGGDNAGQYRLDMSEFRKDMAIVAAAGGNMGQEIARAKVGKYVHMSDSVTSKLNVAFSTKGAEDLEE